MFTYEKGEWEVGWLPISSREWTLSWPTALAQGHLSQCYCLPQLWDEIGLLSSASQYEKDSCLPGFSFSLCKISGILVACTWYLAPELLVFPAELWPEGGGTQQHLLHLPSINTTLQLWVQQDWAALDMSYLCPKQGRLNQMWLPPSPITHSLHPHPVITVHTQQARRGVQFPKKLQTPLTSWNSLWHLILWQEKM